MGFPDVNHPPRGFPLPAPFARRRRVPVETSIKKPVSVGRFLFNKLCGTGRRWHSLFSIFTTRTSCLIRFVTGVAKKGANPWSSIVATHIAILLFRRNSDPRVVLLARKNVSTKTIAPLP